MKYDIYGDNSFLKHIQIANIKSKILSYIIKDDYLSYGIGGGNRDFIFITGYNDEERDIPAFDHPIFMEGLLGKRYIVSDLRKYTKSNLKDKPLLLKDVLNNYSYGMFVINRAIISDMYEQDVYKLNIIQEPVASIFAMLVSTYIESMITLTLREKVLVEASAYVYVCNMFLTDYNKNDKISFFKTKLKSARISFPVLNEYVDIIMSTNLEASNFNHMFENIGFILGSKKNAITLVGFYNAVSTLWYGPGTMETTLLMLNDLPTMVSLYNSALTDTSFRKSKISTIIEKNKKKLDMDKFNKLNLNIKNYD